MISVKVKYRPSTVSGQKGTIFYQLILNRKVRQLNSDYHIYPNEWDESRSMVITEKNSSRNLSLLSIRDRILWEVESLNKIASKFDAGKKAHTADDIIETFKRYRTEYTVFNYLEHLIVRFLQHGKIRTSETYTATLNSFRQFRGGEDLMLECLTSDIMEEFESWHKKKGNTPNTISFYTRILRAAYNRAVEDGIIENKYPFRHVYTGIDKTLKRALTLSNLKRIKDLELSDKPSVDFARDMFIMSFYLRGMSYIDMAFLKKSDLKNDSIVYRRRKTGQQLCIAWTPEMQEILDKYPENPTCYLLPIITKSGCNERKEYKNVGAKINYNLRKVGEKAGLAQTLTMYVARHSWATAAKSKGIPIGVISEGMGHDSENTTRIYLASIDNSMIDEANSIIIGSL